MRLTLTGLSIALVLGIILGGRISNLASIKLRWWGLAVLALALQLAPIPSSWPNDAGPALLLGSFVLLIAFSLRNVRLVGFLLVLAGMLMNFVVIYANWGMPVTRHALIASSQPEALAELERGPGEKHHVADRHDRLMQLADVIPLGRPIRQAVSVGDLVMHSGMIWFLVTTMRRGWPYLSPEEPPVLRHPEASFDGTGP
jgi:hypothetical protein